MEKETTKGKKRVKNYQTTAKAKRVMVGKTSSYP
jgi:hypothetical protein